MLDELARVFEADSTPNTHPILASVQNADDISSVFDAITYGKVCKKDILIVAIN